MSKQGKIINLSFSRRIPQRNICNTFFLTLCAKMLALGERLHITAVRALTPQRIDKSKSLSSPIMLQPHLHLTSCKTALISSPNPYNVSAHMNLKTHQGGEVSKNPQSLKCTHRLQLLELLKIKIPHLLVQCHRRPCFALGDNTHLL